MLLAPFPLSRFPARIAHKTRCSWMNLPQEITCPREPVLQDSQEGGRVARGPPGEADPSQEPAASSFFAPASPRRRFPTAPYRGGANARCSGAPRPGPGGSAPVGVPDREGPPPEGYGLREAVEVPPVGYSLLRSDPVPV